MISVLTQELDMYRNHVDAEYSDEYDSGDEVTKGTTTQKRIKLRVKKKVAHLEEYIRDQVKPEIEARYENEIRRRFESHNKEIQIVKENFEKKLQELRIQQEAML